MKHTTVRLLSGATAAGLLLAALVIAPRFLYSQGSLTPPPGAPGPVMKTLVEVEPRIIVNATNTPGDSDSLHVIKFPGSYYLTANISGASRQNGIKIVSGNVTLDLNGFELVGGADSLNGILFPDGGGYFGNTVRNGTIRVWGGDGIRALGASSSRFEALGAAFNTGAGIRTASSNVVDGCRANSNSEDGIAVGGSCTITGCTASNNDGIGFSCAGKGNSFAQCAAVGNMGGGFSGSTRCAIASCSAMGNQSFGFFAGTASTLTHCVAADNNGSSSYGIFAGEGSTLTNCTASNNQAQDAILVGNGSTVAHCTAIFNTDSNTFSTGILAGAGCTVIACAARGEYQHQYDCQSHDRHGHCSGNRNAGERLHCQWQQG